MHSLRTLLAVAAAFLLSACAANSYAEFYKPNGAPHLPYVTFNGTPQVMSSSGDATQDTANMFANGYGVVGSTSFIGPLDTQEDAIKQATAVHATYVVIRSNYQSTENGIMPLTTPTATTAYTNGYVGGTIYSGTTTVYGTQTTYVPYSVDRYDQGAIFYAPIERTGIGFMLNDVPVATRQQMGTNYGRLIIAVRRESPAFKANIIPGDVLLSIGDTQIASDDDAGAALAAGTGKTNAIKVWRSGETKSIDVDLPVTW